MTAPDTTSPVLADRELLELAARAFWAGEIDDVVSIRWSEEDGCIAYIHGDNQDHNGCDQEFIWDPLEDDGDAMRLAVKLGISISFSHSTRNSWDFPAIVEIGAFAGWCPTFTEANVNDWAAATRRAIVRAAAALAKASEVASQGAGE